MTAITLDTLWMNDAGDLSDRAAFPFLSSLSVTPARAGEVRRSASGRLRAIKSGGSKPSRSVEVTISGCDRDRAAWVEDHVGSLVCVRDDRGRKVWGVYFEVSISEYADDSDLTEVGFTVQEVTHSEEV